MSDPQDPAPHFNVMGLVDIGFFSGKKKEMGAFYAKLGFAEVFSGDEVSVLRAGNQDINFMPNSSEADWFGTTKEDLTRSPILSNTTSMYRRMHLSQLSPRVTPRLCLLRNNRLPLCFLRKS